MNIEFISDKFEFLFNNQIITQHILIDYWLLILLWWLVILI